MSDPVPVIPLEYAPPDERPRRLRTWRSVSAWCLVLSWVCCAAAWGLIVYLEVESVLVTGPILLLLGAALLIGGVVLRRPLTACVGAAHCAVCVLFVALVNLLAWSPSEARWPFTAMGAVYTLGIATPTALALFRDMKAGGELRGMSFSA